MSFRFLHELDWCFLDQVHSLNLVDEVVDCLMNQNFTTDRILEKFGVVQEVDLLYQGPGRVSSYEASQLNKDDYGIREVRLSISQEPWVLARTACSLETLRLIDQSNGPLGAFLKSNAYKRSHVEVSKIDVITMHQTKYFFPGLRRSVWSNPSAAKIVLLEVFLGQIDLR